MDHWANSDIFGKSSFALAHIRVSLDYLQSIVTK